MIDLPWKMSSTFVGQPSTEPAPNPLDVTYRVRPCEPLRKVFRKCCGCMYANTSHNFADGVERGTLIEFVCGCGNHPSVMVCDGKVIGTSA